MEAETVHSPNLKTILMVEEALETADYPIRREQLKRILPKQVMHQTLNVILAYLERSGKIYDGRKGITWVYNPSEKIDRLIAQGTSFSVLRQERRIADAQKASRGRRKGR